jgi:hypothetical protein
MLPITNNHQMKPNTNNQAGKGDTPRPVDTTAFGQNYEAIFRKKKWPNDPEPFESEDHDNDAETYQEQ